MFDICRLGIQDPFSLSSDPELYQVNEEINPRLDQGTSF